ncbi:ribonuclease J [Candidatus Roizmanbacteria bacterium]|jgi:ribonuclease J|nr:ribonuclease J [Candidatus Roizmanbacteria bacterium]
MNNYKLRFVPLGGVVGVTKNMYLYELYKDDRLTDILIVDCGIGFPQEKELGVDFIIPDISYLADKKDKIRGVILTHGHEDHISALPYHYRDLGSPQVLTSKLTSAFIENKFKEFKLNIRLSQIDYDKEYRLGAFSVSFIRLTHSIPDTMHLFIKTPVGNIYHGPDFKLDLTPPFGSPPDFKKIVEAGSQGILCLLSDCLGAEREGLTLSENAIGQTFEDEMRKTKGKFIMTTFSSNISRIRQCVEAAIKFNRKIVFLGRSMKENTRMASEIGYLPIPHNFLIEDKEVPKSPANKICIIAAGSQGQYDSALSKMANNKNQFIKLVSGDKVVFSSDPIPGNETEIYALIEQLSLIGVEVIYPDIQEQLHASGHGSQEDLKFLVRFTNPRYIIPIGGTVRHQQRYQKLTSDLGYQKDKVLMLAEGETVVFVKNNAYKDKTVETKNIYVDAYGVGDVGNVVLRDRKTLASDGMVVALVIVNNQGQLISRPRLISRGFVFEKEESDLYQKAVRAMEKSLKQKGQSQAVNLNNLKKEVIKNLEDIFYQEKGRKPLVVVEAIQI